jgi:uncharacterized tellurite resistance protein B-like protein
MFDALKTFFAEIGGAGPGKIFREDDYRLAAVALVVNIANVDGEIHDEERERLKILIETRFGLDDAAAAELVAQGEQSDRDAVDFFRFTSILKRQLDEPARARVVEMLWDIAYADGEVHEFEESTIGRIADLLDVSNHERILSRQRAARAPLAEDAVEPILAAPREGEA